MTVPDANIFLYAYNEDAPQHGAAGKWLEQVLNGPDLVGLPWTTVWAFLRISTNARAWPKPLSVDEAFTVIDQLLDRPNVAVLHPGPRHRELLERLVREGSASGPLVSDAVLAAIAIENGAAVASSDRDFSRVRRLRWINPLG